MNTIAYDRREPGLDPYQDEPTDQPLPRRPRRNFFNRKSAALVAILTCAAGFYAGVRIEKGQIASTPSTFTLPTSGSGASGARAGAAGSAATAGGASRTAGAGGAAGGFAGLGSRLGAGGAGSASFGSVSTVDGRTLVVTEASGNTVKVKLSPSTKVTKSQSVPHSAIRPGDTVVIEGVPNSSGTVVAATVSDTGAGRAGGSGAFGGGGGGGAGSASGGSGSASGSGGSSSAVGSLFSGAGGK